MRYFTGIVAFFAVIVACCQALGQGAEFKTLEGTWQITELVIGGLKIPEKEVAGMKFVFSKDKDKDKDVAYEKLTIHPPPADTGVVEKRTFKLKFNNAKKPAEVNTEALDGEFKGVVSPGIYDVKGDVLRWCQSDDEKATERPKEFVSPDKSRIYIFTFKRVK